MLARSRQARNSPEWGENLPLSSHLFYVIDNESPHLLV